MSLTWELSQPASKSTWPTSVGPRCCLQRPLRITQRSALPPPPSDTTPPAPQLTCGPKDSTPPQSLLNSAKPPQRPSRRRPTQALNVPALAPTRG
eukprot:2850434-Pleurochrysis_carterae.AAC.1